jgi:Xaa-Pro aminopeptidase
MLWVPEEKLYIRVEDTIVITETGYEVLTNQVPFEIDEIEALMKASP